jgi:putative FmdB family regulatory protein
MPIYEYLCQACAHRFEVRQKFSDPPIETCVRCGKSVKKVISPPAIMFKGSGWYVTDYSEKLKAPTEAAPKNGQAGAKTEASQEAKEKPAAASNESASPAAAKTSPPTASTPASGSTGSSNSSGSSTPASGS